MLNKIFDAFPPPKFLNIPFSSLAISDSAIRSIKFGRKNGTLFVEKYGERGIPPGVIVAGQINNKEELIHILSDMKKELDLDYVKMSLPEEKAYLFTAKIPIVKQQEVKSAIESKIEENVPVSPMELVFDYKLFDHRQKEHLDVVVSTLPINVVDSYVELANGANLKLLSLEIESQAIVRALITEGILATSLIVHFSQDKVGLYIESFGVVRFTSTIPLRGDNANNPSYLSQEIKKLYLYWHTLKEVVDKPDMKISQIIVCGENITDDTIPYLSAHNQTPTVLGNVWKNAFDINKNVPEISFLDSLKYASAVGLALPGEILI
jgi:hypothetical protein